MYFKFLYLQSLGVCFCIKYEVYFLPDSFSIIRMTSYSSTDIFNIFPLKQNTNL